MLDSSTPDCSSLDSSELYPVYLNVLNHYWKLLSLNNWLGAGYSYELSRDKQSSNELSGKELSFLLNLVPILLNTTAPARGANHIHMLKPWGSKK